MGKNRLCAVPVDWEDTVRHRVSATGLTVAAILSVVLFGGCSASSGGSPVAAGATASPSSAAAVTKTGRPVAGKTIPDGTYSTVVRRSEEIKKGFKPAFVDHLLGPDGRMPTTLKLERGFFSIFVTSDAGLVELGDTGTATYDPSGPLIMTSASSGCHGCVYFYRWTYDGTWLTLAITKKEHVPEVEDGAEVVTNHTYRKIK